MRPRSRTASMLRLAPPFVPRATVLLTAVLLLVGAPALAQSDALPGVEYQEMSDAPSSPTTPTLSSAGVTLTRITDLVIVRPTVLALGAVSAATYALAIGPTLVLEPERFDDVTQSMLYGPWRFALLRPLGAPVLPAE